jgi:hypothetical protein
VKIRLTINGQRRDGTLAGTPAAQDFYARLPLRLTLDDYARTEKIAYLAEPLSGEDAAQVSRRARVTLLHGTGEAWTP